MSVFAKDLVRKMLDAEREIRLREAAIRRRMERRLKHYENMFTPPKFDREKEIESVDFLVFKHARSAINELTPSGYLQFTLNGEHWK
jgi:hypothetical protein